MEHENLSAWSTLYFMRPDPLLRLQEGMQSLEQMRRGIVREMWESIWRSTWEQPRRL